MSRYQKSEIGRIPSTETVWVLRRGSTIRDSTDTVCRGCCISGEHTYQTDVKVFNSEDEARRARNPLRSSLYFFKKYGTDSRGSDCQYEEYWIEKQIRGPEGKVKERLEVCEITDCPISGRNDPLHKTETFRYLGSEF